MKLIKIINEDRETEFISFWCPDVIINKFISENKDRIGNTINSDSAKDDIVEVD